MQAIRIHAGNILVAGVTTYLRRVGYQSHMGSFLFFDTAVATMTNNTADLTMGALDELGILQEDLLPYLQRR